MRTREPNARWATRFAFVPLVVVCLGGLAVAQDDLLQSLVEKNEAAWQRIQSLPSIQYTMEREWLDRQSQQPFHGVGQVKKKGNCCWSTYRCTIHTGPLQVVAEKERKVGNRSIPMRLLKPDTSAGLTEETEMRLVLNDKYLAVWPKTTNPFAYQQDFNSIDAMSEEMKERLEMSMPPEFLQHCFSDGARRLCEALQSDPNRVRFDTVERKAEDGRRRYEIRRFYPKDAPRPDLTWVIDPQKGCLATESVFYAGRETPLRRSIMRVEEIAPGLWYPVGYEETEYAEPKPSGGPPVVRGWTKATVRDIKIGEAIPDAQFNIEALGLQRDKQDITVLRTTIDDQTIPYVYREGKLVPRSGPKK